MLILIDLPGGHPQVMFAAMLASVGRQAPPRAVCFSGAKTEGFGAKWEPGVPRGTPKPVIAKLNAAAVGALADVTVRARLAHIGQEIFPREQQSPEALEALNRSEIEKWWPIIKAAGIKVEGGSPERSLGAGTPLQSYSFTAPVIAEIGSQQQRHLLRLTMIEDCRYHVLHASSERDSDVRNFFKMFLRARRVPKFSRGQDPNSTWSICDLLGATEEVLSVKALGGFSRS